MKKKTFLAISHLTQLFHLWLDVTKLFVGRGHGWLQTLPHPLIGFFSNLGKYPSKMG